LFEGKVNLRDFTVVDVRRSIRRKGEAETLAGLFGNFQGFSG
jgi:hypothetical protein